MNLNIKYKTIKCLEQITGEVLQNLQLGEYVSDMPLKVWSIKKKNTGFQPNWKTLLCKKNLCKE